MSRESVLGRVAALLDRDPGHPLRVGIDGVCGAGKSGFADDLAKVLRALGRPVIRLDSDGFHHRRAVRHRNATDPARGYYDDAYDFGALVDRVLLPLGGSVPHRFVTAVMDLASDEPVDSWSTAVRDAVVLFDCTFLQRGDLRPLWDEVVFLEVPLDVASRRGAARDSAALGGERRARSAYEIRYAAACRIYLREEAPAVRASILVDHSDPGSPHLLRPLSQPAARSAAPPATV